MVKKSVESVVTDLCHKISVGGYESQQLLSCFAYFLGSLDAIYNDGIYPPTLDRVSDALVRAYYHGFED